MLTGLDIFCGAGGSSAGARAAGVSMRAAIDLCPVATATYRVNFPGAKVLTERVEQADVHALYREIGEIDVLMASPECTNHTCAKGAKPRDENSRATAMHVIRYARTFLPRWLVIENVVHMRPWHRYEELKSDLTCLGYKLAEQVLNAADFGVPQSRRRLFLVGDLKKAPQLATLSPFRKRKCAASIIDTDERWKSTALFTPKRAQGTLERAARAFKALGRKKEFLIVYYGSDGSGGWQALDKPLRTVTTIDRFALVKPTPRGHMMRMLQVPEIKRAMGFESTFALPFGTRRDQIKLLGNGVCPPVMKEVLRALTSA